MTVKPTFKATILKLGANPYVDVPQRVSKAFGQRGFIYVKGTLDGQPFRSTLVPRGEASHRLFINGGMRKSAGVAVGDTVTVRVEIDRRSRELPMPRELEAALADNDLLDAFNRLTPSDRRYVLVWLASSKKQETWERRVEILAQRLARGERPSEAFGVSLSAMPQRQE